MNNENSFGKNSSMIKSEIQSLKKYLAVHLTYALEHAKARVLFEMKEKKGLTQKEKERMRFWVLRENFWKEAKEVKLGFFFA